MNNAVLNSNTSILLTGGTGSFGKAFVGQILEAFPLIKRLVIFSRDELKQSEMQHLYGADKYPGIRYFIGDVRDQKRLMAAFEGVDIVVHAAALKQVSTAEYNPFEYIKTNVLGAQNVIESALSSNVKKIIALSTDKAAGPVNLYGATKLCSDKLFIAANNIVGKRDLSFSVVRYGNVMGSRGSVIPFFLNKRKSGLIPITSNDMTRFNITLQESVQMVRWAIDNSVGGEIFVPKLPSYRILDLAAAIAPEATYKEIGIRPGEKIHEDMITESDSISTIDIGDYFVILPSSDSNVSKKYLEFFKGSFVKPGFRYNSGSNSHFLSTVEIQNLIRTHIEPNL